MVRMNMSVRASAAALVVTFATTGSPATVPESVRGDESARLLYADCGNMSVAVEDLDADAGEIGLTKSAIQNALEARIRSAKLYASIGGAPQFIYANVMVVGKAFSIRLGLYRWIKDAGFGLDGFVVVWSRATTGTHGQDSQYIVGALSQLVDAFIVEYLRANESVCANERMEHSN